MVVLCHSPTPRTLSGVRDRVDHRLPGAVRRRDREPVPRRGLENSVLRSGTAPTPLSGAAATLVGQYVRVPGVSSETPWLLPFDVVPEDLFMLDYRPLCGNVVYGRRKGPVLKARPSRLAHLPGFPGRNSLFVYLVCQPVLIAALAGSGSESLALCERVRVSFFRRSRYSRERSWWRNFGGYARG